MKSRWVIIIACFLLILVKILFPNTQVDATTVWLLVVSVIVFILPYLPDLSEHVKHVKWGDKEIEFRIKELRTNVAQATQATEQKIGIEASPEDQPEASVEGEQEQLREEAEQVSNSVETILQEASKDPRAALLLLSAKLESQLRKSLSDQGISLQPQFYSMRKMAEFGVAHGLFPKEFLPAIKTFSEVRNQVAHEAFEAKDAYILSIIALGIDLLRIASDPSKN